MRILFAGTPDIAVPSLKALAEKFEICAVLTNPDRETGRGRKIVSSPVYETARELGLNILQPEKLDEEFLDEVRALKPDLLAVIAFGKIFRKNFLDLFPLGGINLHPSLLPKYRGPSPLNEAIRNGDALTGITVQKLALKMDSGDILLQPELKLDGSETTGSLTEKVAELGAPLMVEAVELLMADPGAGHPQDDGQATFCRLISKEDGEIDWTASAEQIQRNIRANDPWPGTYSWYGDKKINILEAEVYRGDALSGKPGTVLSYSKKDGILVAAGSGVLAVKRLQLQSKKPMDYKSFVNGNRDFVGSILQSPSGDSA
ncbi:methionyl-tRNA formyltransferase [Spirochaeta isovalerica]|uniref:Methionyl-tRNA formyltransferase n=1 Tax=Spirochaeta isovalerica TaxID=150 RepID=A0A841RA59_9SPIO|nr:methionyl-tRNA formyltransferase [Spirochaeta isovalerica]MBB6480795.1 methionyl-tRNA formyltransferase [Spirochaeta isovalerica]